jgi:hypothetical protein
LGQFECGTLRERYKCIGFAGTVQKAGKGWYVKRGKEGGGVRCSTEREFFHLNQKKEREEGV